MDFTNLCLLLEWWWAPLPVVAEGAWVHQAFGILTESPLTFVPVAYITCHVFACARVEKNDSA